MFAITNSHVLGLRLPRCGCEAIQSCDHGLAAWVDCNRCFKQSKGMAESMKNKSTVMLGNFGVFASLAICQYLELASFTTSLGSSCPICRLSLLYPHLLYQLALCEPGPDDLLSIVQVIFRQHNATRLNSLGRSLLRQSHPTSTGNRELAASAWATADM